MLRTSNLINWLETCRLKKSIKFLRKSKNIRVAFTSAHETAKTPEIKFDLESEMTAMFTKQFKKNLKKKKPEFKDPSSKDKGNEKPNTFP